MRFLKFLHFLPLRAALAAASLLTPFCAQAQGGPPPPPQPLGPPPVPAGNPITAAKVALGQTLFWDEQLSLTGTVACGTCHRSAAGGSDPRSASVLAPSVNPGFDNVFGTPDDVRGSLGVPAHGADGLYAASASFGLGAQVGRRKSPSAVGAAYAPLLFWDGRAGGTFADPVTGSVILQAGGALENQSLAPMLDSAEMAYSGATVAALPARVAGAAPLALAENVPPALAQWLGTRDYPALFAEAFGTPAITPARMALAIATYERTLAPTQTPFDAENGGTPSLTAQELQGRQLFVANDCAACHAGALLSDQQFHYIGVRPPAEDLGRFAQTSNPADRGAFRTPSLRNVELRAPYMHDGRFATLADVVDFYDRGGDFNAPNKDPRVRPRGLTPQQKAAIVAFLRRPLTDPRAMAETAPFDRPRLFGEGARVPVVAGAGVAGGNGVPAIVALEPALLGSQNFTVALANAPAGATARLVVAHADPGTDPAPATGDVYDATIVVAANGTASLNVELAPPRVRSGDTIRGRWYVAGGVSPVFSAPVFGNDALSRDGFE